MSKETLNFSPKLYGKILSSALKKTYQEIPVLDSSVDYWLVRAKSGQFYTDFNINDYIGIGWNEVTLEDIKSVNNSAEMLKDILRKKLNPTSIGRQNEVEELSLFDFISEVEKNVITENQYGTWAGQLLRFVNNLKINDIVVVPSENSEFLLVGKIIGDIYECSDDELQSTEEHSNYQKSDFKKRWPVRWFGYFDRNNADSKLYKMIYAQATLSNINDYKPFINRAIFPFYIQDGKLFISMYVSQPNDIDSEYLGQFIYQYSLLNKSFNSKTKVVSKVNVQSEGVIELISNLAPYGLGAFAILAIVLVAPYGGEMKFLGHSLKIPGFFNGYQNNKAQKIENDGKELDNIKKAKQLSDELKVPISELGIKLPAQLVNLLNKNISDEIEKNSKSDSPDKQDCDN